MNSFMAPAVQKVLEAIAALEVGHASASGARHGDCRTRWSSSIKKDYYSWVLRARIQKGAYSHSHRATFLVWSAEHEFEGGLNQCLEWKRNNRSTVPMSSSI